MGSKSQAKGRRGEIELADLLRCYGCNVRPGEPLNYGKEPDLVGLPHVHCEVKRTEKMKMGEWLDQAQRDSERFGGVPAVFHRSNRRPWTVTMLLKDWMELYLASERKISEKNGKEIPFDTE